MYTVHTRYINLEDGVEEQHTEVFNNLVQAVIFYILVYWGSKEDMYPFGGSQILKIATQLKVSIWK